jgi:hypothetical protein
MCESEFITPAREVESRLPVPYPMGAGASTKEFNRYFAAADFETRNLIQKQGGTIKMVMTEEVLDDWEA